MIEIKGLTKTFPGKVQALRGIDLSIGAGMFGLLGPNGAGKTTLMRTIAGLLRPTSGTITVFGNDISTPAGKQAAKTLLGYLPQDLGLYPNLNAREFLDYVAILKGMTDANQRKKQIAELLDVVRLVDVADRKLKTYSGGMRRRVGIAQALLGNPRLIIVDEPTTGLDPEERIRLRNFLGEIARNCTIILSTHIIEDISVSCQQMAVIAHGQVLFAGTPGELIKNARGMVWTINTAGAMPNHGLSVVTTLQLADAVQYRVIGTSARTQYADAALVEPNLEDGYMWLMKSREAQTA